MPNYCLELYMPRASATRVEEAARQARLAAEVLSTNGIPIHYIRTTYLAEDETCFHLFEASSAEDVAEAARRAGLASGRITRAIEAPAASAPGPSRTATRRDLHAGQRQRKE